MNTDRQRKIDACNIYIDGKRIAAMREISKATFGESFMLIEVDTLAREFVLRLDDSSGNGIDIDKLTKFIRKYPLCKVRVYEQKDMSAFIGSKKS